MTLLLGLDTSTRTASVAVYDGERVLSETTWLAGREHSTRLLLEAESALARVGHAPNDVTGVVVAVGPGSYTGVRVAISAARGMAAALRLPVWGISTLDVVAAAAGVGRWPVRVVLEAGRGRMATALYAHGEQVQVARLATLDELMGLLDEPTLVIGELSGEARLALTEHGSVHLAPPAASLRRAGYLVELGWQRKCSGDPGNPNAVDAVYLT